MYIAHSKNSEGQTHSLVEHVNSVAELARHFAGKFGAAELGHWIGVWHDLGKFHPDFQAYLLQNADRRGPDHKAAGAILALKHIERLSFPIAGHHGGLKCSADLRGWLREKKESPQVREALEAARETMNSIEPQDPLPQPRQAGSTLDTEFFLRMLFSALVDADFLDTEAHFDPQQHDRRSDYPSLAELWRRFEQDQDELTGHADDPVNLARHEIYKACLQKADESPGFFRLTAPTGGGKTRSGIAFALKHAIKHNLDRCIVAMPYTSIIDQTADIYREIFGEDVIVEHHSAVAPPDPDEPSEADIRARLASENWDAPIIATTTVQLFESMFSNKPSRCRKLHNIAKSVIILDEAQTIPTSLLDTILDGLRQLVDNYGCSIVLCTATQPAFDSSPHLRGLENVREIVPDPRRLFLALKRVDYELPAADEEWGWERVAEEMRTNDQVLAVVNTKNDALELLEALDDPEALHLSALLCAAHRRDVLAEVKQRLDSGKPCRLVSTQVVEAGVNLDFPFVLRAIGPLDRIVQVAGRCNREGRLETGRVVVFAPKDGGMPPGEYRTGTDIAKTLFYQDSDLHRPKVYSTYFRRLYRSVETDARDIQSRREVMDYPEVANRFRLIDDDTVSVVVRYREEVGQLIERVSTPPGLTRELLRSLQPYVVSVWRRLANQYQQDGFLRELSPGLYEWLGVYDRIRGLAVGNRDPSDFVV